MIRAILVPVVLILLGSTVAFSSDGQSYDYKYSLLPLESEQFDNEELSRWIRPVIPAVLDAKNTVVSTSDLRGVALVISEEEILVSTEVFLAIDLVGTVAETLDVDPTTLHMGAILVWDILPGGDSGTLSGETIPFVSLTFLRENHDIGFVKLSRHPRYSGAFPSPEEFPYPIFEGTLSPLQNVFVVGHHRTNKPELIMTFTVGTVRLVREDIARIQVSASKFDFGAPVFVLSDEGLFSLAGFIRWVRVESRIETEVEMLLLGSLDTLTINKGGEN